MSTFLLKFEAIESRIASYSCPRGTSGRVHALRLRRCFQQNSRQRSLAAGVKLQSVISDQELHTPSTLEQSADPVELREKLAIGALEGRRYTKTRYIATLRELRMKHRHTNKIRDPYNLKGDTGAVKLQEYGVVLPPDLENSTLDDPDQGTAKLYEALRIGDSHGVLEAILNHIKQVGFDEYAHSFLSVIPAVTFSEILRCLDPKHFVSRYSDLYEGISPSYAVVLGLPPVDQDGHYDFCKLFLGQVRSILQARQSTRPLSLSDYKYLLKCTRAIGDIKSSTSIWSSMQNTGFDPVTRIRHIPIAPDVECYNHYMATRCWADSLNPIQRYRRRVIPDNFEPRSWVEVPYTLKGQRIGPRGLKAQLSTIFRDMVEKGIPGNEETFCLMMVALARENDMSGLQSILKRVWEIDVEKIRQIDEPELPLPKSYHSHSPFYPSKNLLFTLAHCYGINNSIPTALRLIDYVSRHYSILITQDVWKELLQWTYVLSVKRFSTRLTDGTSMGQLPQAAVGNLWDTMTSEPYNVKPDMVMYNRLILNLLQRQRYGEAQTRMEEAREAHKRDVLKLSQIIRAFDTSGPQTPKHVREQRARDLDLTHLRVRVNRQYIRRWVRLIISQGSSSLEADELWVYQNIPKFVQSWSLFLPRMLKYKTGTGEICFGIGYKNRNAELQQRFLARNMASIDRMQFDQESDGEDRRREQEREEKNTQEG